MIYFQLSYENNNQLIPHNQPHSIDYVVDLSTKLWISSRNYDPIKYKNYNIQKRIVHLVYSAFLKLDNTKTDSVILPNEAQEKLIQEKSIEFRIGAPITFLMKLAPEGHFIHNWNYPDLYKSEEINIELVNNLQKMYLSGLATKYKHHIIEKPLPENYILFIHQGLERVHYYNKKYGLDVMKEISQWARDNRRNVLFRYHPTSRENFTSCSEELKNDYTYFDTSSSIVELVKNCKQLWTISSSVGMEGIFLKKPVTIFGMADYYPVVNRAETVDQAFIDTFSTEKYDRFLSWYVKRMCINIFNVNAEKQIFDRLNRYLVTGESIENIY